MTAFLEHIAAHVGSYTAKHGHAPDVIRLPRRDLHVVAKEIRALLEKGYSYEFDPSRRETGPDKLYGVPVEGVDTDGIPHSPAGGLTACGSLFERERQCDSPWCHCTCRAAELMLFAGRHSCGKPDILR